MKACPYCGGQYPDEVDLCPIDRHALVDSQGFKTAGEKSKITCPACAAVGDNTFTVTPRSSFSLLAFLSGGILAVLFRNAGGNRRVLCNRCDARFYVRTPLSRISLVLFWLVVSPTI